MDKELPCPLILENSFSTLTQTSLHPPHLTIPSWAFGLGNLGQESQWVARVKKVHSPWLLKLENTQAGVFQVKSKEHWLSQGHGKTGPSTSRALWVTVRPARLHSSRSGGRPRGLCAQDSPPGARCVTTARGESEFLEMFTSD